MKKFTMFACLAVASVFAFSAIAGDFPQLHQSNPLDLGGSVDFNKAGLDTINLMAAGDDPTNNSSPDDLGLEPYYIGDFEDGWGEWIHYDITQPLETHWNVSTYNQPDPNNYAAWCGDPDIASCGPDDPEGGYGNSWHDLIEFRQAVPNTDTSSLVTITATLIHDSEPAYDYTYLSYKFNGQPFADIQSWDGRGDGVAVNGSVTYLPPEYMGGSDIAIYFRFKSDGGWSDEDCSWPTSGACQIDDINVNIVNGAFEGDFFEDFEHGGVPDDFGIWAVGFPDGVGDYAQIWEGLEDADPCFTNYTPSAAFIDDGIIVPGTGGSDCINWCYGPGGYIVNTTGGLAGEAEHLHNAIESPVMNWPHPKNGAPGPDYDGIELRVSAYRHEDLSSDAPGIFYTWGVRSADVDGSAGDAQDITAQGWLDRNFVYWGGPDYIRAGDDVTDLMNPGRDVVQVQLAAYELGWVWGYVGNDGYPAPYFDDVTVKIFPVIGPGMSSREIDRAQDNWPSRQSIDYGDLASHSIRFDMANTVAVTGHDVIDPGDSTVIDISPVRAGADFDGDPILIYSLMANPVFTPAMRTAGLPDQGSVVGMPAVGASGNVTPGKWAFDLPDTGFLFPGDVLHYYISATDAIGGVGGTDPQTATLPANIDGFGVFGDPLGYSSTYTFHGLPSIRPDGEGGFEHPGMLFLNDFANRGGENEWYMALNNIGLLSSVDYDIYYTSGPSSGVSSGIGGRANHLLLTDYTEILYTCGTLGSFTISNGDFANDGGDDVGVLTNWLDLGGKDIFLTGDELASDLAQSGSATLTFMENYMGVTSLGNDVRPLIGNQTTPLVKVISGNPVFTGNLETWIAYGGCLQINTFDAVQTFGTGQRIAEFDDPNGGSFPYAAATLNIVNPGPTESKVISMPVDLMFVYTDPAAAGNDLPGRAQLLEDVLAYFGVVGDPQNVSGVDVPGITFKTSNYPNPFNPSTTIKYSMPKAGHLKLSIYNVRGQLVKTMIDGQVAMGDGQIIWDGTNNQGSSVSSGVYFYEARTGGNVLVQKMALVK